VPAAEAAGCKIFIGVAGMAAHLPGVIAALTTKPVIGVPCAGSMDGLDALLSVAQMPPGIPVACVAIGGGRNAGLLAIEMLALGDTALADRLVEFRRKLQQNNRSAGDQLRDGLASD
jgi:5-(carboxyamino)imidazole ribonucleotide mutase